MTAKSQASGHEVAWRNGKWVYADDGNPVDDSERPCKVCGANAIEVTITQRIRVDRCIAQEIVWLNACGVRTEGCCCGHDKHLATALITPSSVMRAEELGYYPVYSKGTGLFVIELKTGRGGTRDAGGREI